MMGIGRSLFKGTEGSINMGDLWLWEDGIKRIFGSMGRASPFMTMGGFRLKRLMDTVEHYRTITYGWEAGEYIEESGVQTIGRGSQSGPKPLENTIRAFLKQ